MSDLFSIFGMEILSDIIPILSDIKGLYFRGPYIFGVISVVDNLWMKLSRVIHLSFCVACLKILRRALWDAARYSEILIQKILDWNSKNFFQNHSSSRCLVFFSVSVPFCGPTLLFLKILKNSQKMGNRADFSSRMRRKPEFWIFFGLVLNNQIFRDRNVDSKTTLSEFSSRFP